jgi:hypothetical protein
VIGNGVVIDPRVLTEEIDNLRGEGHRRQRAQGLGQRAPDHALPPDARPRRRGEARQARDRHDEARDRARATPTRPARLGSACRTCSTRRSSRRRSWPRSSPSGLSLRPFARDPR